MAKTISLDHPLIQTYLFYASVLVIKMLAMSFLTAARRFKNMAFANPEDADALKTKIKFEESVERVRRAHRNDLENVPLFFVISFIYILTNPSVTLATWLIRVYAAARIAHSFVYAVIVIPQPARGLSFAIGGLVTGYMAISSTLYFL